jgi:ubiquitin-protein ligase
MPWLPENIWRRRLTVEYEQMRASNFSFTASEDYTRYNVFLKGRGFVRENNVVVPRDSHEVMITLKREYPYAGGLDLVWRTPIFHPNIRESDGRVCIQLVNEWAETQTVLHVVQALERLLREPNPASPLNLDAAEYYVRNGLVEAPKAKPGRPRLVFE